jgi:hypothetical protein
MLMITFPLFLGQPEQIDMSHRSTSIRAAVHTTQAVVEKRNKGTRRQRTLLL